MLCRSTSTIVVKKPVVSSEPTIETETTRDQPGEKALPTSNLFSEKVWGSFYEGARGLFYSVRVLPLYGNVPPIRMLPSFTGD